MSENSLQVKRKARTEERPKGKRRRTVRESRRRIRSGS